MRSTQLAALQCDPVQRTRDRWTGDATPELGVSHVPEGLPWGKTRGGRRKRLPRPRRGQVCGRWGAEDAEFEREQDGAARGSADIYLEVPQVPRTRLVLTAGRLRLPWDL